MTQIFDKVKMDKVQGPNLKFVTNENKHSSPDKIEGLQVRFE